MKIVVCMAWAAKPSMKTLVGREVVDENKTLHCLGREIVDENNSQHGLNHDVVDENTSGQRNRRCK